MSHDTTFLPQHFLPYLLNQAAESASRSFQEHYRARYGMLRTEWRVMFHLGSFGPMTAGKICHLASLHKTKVSRAVAALETKRYVSRDVQQHDRRTETLRLTGAGKSAYAALLKAAQDCDARLGAQFSADENAILRSCLTALADLPDPPPEN